ncbi:hypothetical protein GQ43DRAFT_443166 [Delitschia confertaspora ATCC 74209]|uniref:TAFII28-like protein domain-containing protein n=1 Tax=Delitschia confertaspora ATCC 74209 TaxID=1513339 RepID=A0A9P4JFV6_9PLEO|nr:hypothetical protein GQ43DRAFT_443166 [Delitschia confertaspora ATCC 74209]
MASPPHIPTINLPRKRGSVSSTVSQSKKRKPSNLRNAFSPETDDFVGSPLRFSRSPSVESTATTSVHNGVGGSKRGRKRKGADDDTRSITGSLRGGKAGTASMVDGQGGDEDEDEDYDEEGGEGMDTMLEGGQMDEANEKVEMENRRLLMDTMTPNQFHRYETYRRIKLKKETVRKITNQTLSQSVPAPVIIAINGYTKLFIGELLDRAITVRDEWCAARSHIPNPELPLPVLQSALVRPAGYEKERRPTGAEILAAGVSPMGVDPRLGYWREVPADAGLQDRLKMEDKGPLTPDHLREALRRYKRDRDGGGAGFAGLSLEGVERAASRMGGKRLFR